jgi:predicted aspartyl protease
MPSVLLHPTRNELQQEGPCIFISISAPQLEVEEGRKVGLEYPPPFRVRALIDTGASITVVNPQVVQTCKLRQTGYAEIVAAGSSGRYTEHAAAIQFPDNGLEGFELIRLVACPIVRQPVSCLIGRDILRRWVLTYNGPDCSVQVDG